MRPPLSLASSNWTKQRTNWTTSCQDTQTTNIIHGRDFYCTLLSLVCRGHTSTVLIDDCRILSRPYKCFHVRSSTAFWIDVSIVFCSILLHQPLKIHQHPSKNRFQGASHFPSIFHRVFFDVGSIWDANMEVCWPPWDYLGAIGGLLKVSWTVLEASWGLLAAKTHQDRGEKLF